MRARDAPRDGVGRWEQAGDRSARPVDHADDLSSDVHPTCHGSAVLVCDQEGNIVYADSGGWLPLPETGTLAVSRRPADLLGHPLASAVEQAANSVETRGSRHAPGVAHLHLAGTGWVQVQARRSRGGVLFELAEATHARWNSDLAERASSAQVTLLLEQQRQLLTLVQALSTAVTPLDVANAVTGALAVSLQPTFCGIAVADLAAGEMAYLSLHPLPEQTAQSWARFPLHRDSPPTAAVNDQRATFLADRNEAVLAFPGLGPDMDVAGVQALAHLPLVVGGDPLGALALAWAQPRPFTTAEREFLLTVAGHTAQTLQRALLFDEQARNAEALQRALLPDDLPVRPANGGTITAVYRPAGRHALIGGDWYDAFTLPQGRLGLVVGDVVGHGISAAAAMTRLRHAARVYATAGHSVQDVVGLLNRLVCERDEQGATVLYAVLDPRQSTVTWASAGHLPALVVTDHVSELLDRGDSDVSDLLLGVDPAADYRSTVAHLPARSGLLLYTDGLVERSSGGIGEGLRLLQERAGQLLRPVLDDDAAQSAALASLIDVLPGGAGHDDVCVLLATTPAADDRS